MKIKKINLKSLMIIVFLLGFSINLISQNIAITDDDGYSPNTSAMLDVKSTTKGMLVPRVALVTTVDPIGGTKPDGLLVWNTSTSGTYDTPGFYFWNGADWEMVGSDNLFENGLTQSGNAVKLGGSLTNATTIAQGSYNMIYNLTGTGDFDIQDNGTSAFFVADDGNVGIGTNSPGQKLQVNGNFKLDDNIFITGNSDYKVYHNLATLSKDTDPGAIIINTNHPATATCMLRIKVEGYLYDGSGPFEITIGGYLSGNLLHNNGFINVGSLKVPVYSAVNSSNKLAIVIGDISETYSYMHLTVTEYMQGWSGKNETYAEDWDIIVSENLDGYTDINEIYDKTSIDLGNYYTIPEVDNIEDGLQTQVDDLQTQVNNENLWDRTGSVTYLHNSADNIGIGTSNPQANLHIIGDATLGSLLIAPNETTSGDDAELRLAEDNDGSFGMSLKYDGGDNRLYFYGKSNATIYGPHLSISRDEGNIGIGTGTSTTDTRLIVEGNYSGSVEKAIFAVKNNSGDTVFAVYPEGVRIWVDDTPGKATGSKGGFAVGGLNAGKGILTNEFFRITPDSVRIYIADDPGKATGSKGGFAVGGFNAGKDAPVDMMNLTKENYCIGHQSGISTSTGNFNTFFGYQAGMSNETGIKNIFIGYLTGLNNISGHANTFVGSECGWKNSTGQYNSFIGYKSGYYNVSGSYNTYMGYMSGYESGLTTGDDADNNTMVGYKSGYNNRDGDKNVFLGWYSGYYNNDASYNVFIGTESGYSTTDGANNLFLGYRSGYRSATGEYNTYLGYKSGYNSGYGTTSDPDYNTFIGYESGYDCRTGHHNTYIGHSSGYGTSSSGSYNVYMGHFAGYDNTSGHNNVFIGYNAGQNNTTGYDNVFIGHDAGEANLTGNYSTFIGYLAGENSNQGYNTFVGYQAGQMNVDGGTNAYFGYAAGQANTGENNTFIGGEAGYVSGSGSDNTYIGQGAGRECTGSNNVFLGYAAGISVTSSDKLIIENVLDWNANYYPVNSLIYGDFSTNTLRFNADVGIGQSASYKLDVIENNTSYIARFSNSGGEYSEGLIIKAGHIYASGAGYDDIIYINCQDGNGSWVGSIYSNNGNLYMNGKSAQSGKGYDIKETGKGLNIINKLQVVDYDFNSKSNTYKTGFVGEDAIKIFPEMITYQEETDEYGVANSVLVPVLTKAIQEQQKIIDELLERIKKLEEK
ncbi:MAG: tail fiber domain-containing protein [Bacteroidales bacterium]|nr:tail fiber domain-containing protein [Bacteroidales bacterium]